MKLQSETRRRIAQRVASLSGSLERCLGRFLGDELFGGPSLHFHRRAISQVRSHHDARDLLSDELYFEHLYATLASWGLHRMGPGKAKLRDFPVFMQNARSLLREVAALFRCSMLDLSEGEMRDAAKQVGEAIERHKRAAGLTEAESVLVANSKAIHHFLPDLVPPVDRAYTLMFFFNRTEPPGSEAETFVEMYPYFVDIAKRNEALIRAAVKICDSPCTRGDWNSGHAKVVDNALIGWVRLEKEAGRLRRGGTQLAGRGQAARRSDGSVV